MSHFSYENTKNRAAMLYGPSDLRIANLDLEPLSAGEVRVKIEAATTCGTDGKSFLRGGHPQIINKMPSRFGHEMAGTIMDVAPDVTGFFAGDRVVVANSAPCYECFYCLRGRFNLCENIQFINGAYAQYITVPPRFVRFNLHKIPEQLGFVKAALAEPLACVLYACEKIRINPGEAVAVIGTGPMAFLFLQVIRSKKARPIIIGRNPNKLLWARAAGAEATINSSQHDVVQKIRSLTGGYGADVAIEAVGKPETWVEAVNLVCKGGRVCVYGGCAKGTTITLDTYRLHYEEITLMGVFHYTPDVIKRAIKMLAEGRVNTDLFTQEVRTLDQLADVYAGKDDKTVLKYVIKP